MDEYHEHREDCPFKFAPLDVCDCVQKNMADRVCCLIAAAYVDAANLHQSLWRETSAYKTDQILKRTPNEARTALDALLKAERENVLREAAENFRELKMFGSAKECEALISEDKTDG